MSDNEIHPTKLAIKQVRTALGKQFERIDACRDKLSEDDRTRAIVATQNLIDALLNAQRAWEQACYALLSEDERSQAHMRTYQDGSCDLMIDDRVVARWRWEAHCETQPVSPENLLLAT